MLEPEEALPKLLNQKQVAEILGKSTAWLERMRWKGGGPPFRKFGRHVRYSLDDLMQWIESKPKLTSTTEARQEVQK